MNYKNTPKKHTHRKTFSVEIDLGRGCKKRRKEEKEKEKEKKEEKERRGDFSFAEKALDGAVEAVKNKNKNKKPGQNPLNHSSWRCRSNK